MPMVRERGSHAPTEFLELTPSMRPRIEAAVESLLALLDALDGDPDIEDGGDDEPSLGSINSNWNTDWRSQAGWSAGTDEDLEEDAADQCEIDEDQERDPAEEGEPDEGL